MVGVEANTEFKIGVLGGTLINAIVNVPGTEVVSAIILAAVGAVTSFVATFICKRLLEVIRKNSIAKRKKGPS